MATLLALEEQNNKAQCYFLDFLMRDSFMKIRTFASAMTILSIVSVASAAEHFNANLITEKINDKPIELTNSDFLFSTSQIINPIKKHSQTGVDCVYIQGRSKSVVVVFPECL